MNGRLNENSLDVRVMGREDRRRESLPLLFLTTTTTFLLPVHDLIFFRVLLSDRHAAGRGVAVPWVDPNVNNNIPADIVIDRQGAYTALPVGRQGTIK